MKTLADTFKRYFKFKGRADRREFWVWVAAMAAVSFIFVCILAPIALLFGNTHNPVLSGFFTATITLFGLFWLVMFFPTLTVTIRRMRDAGITPWLLIIPAVLGIITFLALFDRALSNMDGTTPDFTDALVFALVEVTALIGIIFIILLCKPSNNNDVLKPKQGCLTTLTIFAGLILAWTIIGILTRTQNLGYASAENVKRYTNIEFPAYKVKWTKKLGALDGFEHQISLKFKDVPEESFYNMLDSLCNGTYPGNEEASEIPYCLWRFENDTYHYSIHNPKGNKSHPVYLFLNSIGFSTELLDRNNISIIIKIHKHEKEWSLDYLESI